MSTRQQNFPKHAKNTQHYLKQHHKQNLEHHRKYQMYNNNADINKHHLQQQQKQFANIQHIYSKIDNSN